MKTLPITLVISALCFLAFVPNESHQTKSQPSKTFASPIEPALHIQGVTIEGEKDKIEEFPYDVVTPLLKSPRLRYTFQHSQLEKRPNKRDESNDKQETPRSEDDLRKKE